MLNNAILFTYVPVIRACILEVLGRLFGSIAGFLLPNKFLLEATVESHLKITPVIKPPKSVCIPVYIVYSLIAELGPLHI